MERSGNETAVPGAARDNQTPPSLCDRCLLHAVVGVAALEVAVRALWALAGVVFDLTTAVFAPPYV